MPRGIEIRPTQDKVRQAVFNILAKVVEGSVVLDLYAGSGAYGLEALSRGAKRVIFVDNNPGCVKAIRYNLERLGIIGDRARIIRQDALKALKGLDSSGSKCDVVFIDPPYYRELAKNCLRNLLQYDILAPNNFIIIERHIADDLGEMSGFIIVDMRRYGDTGITIGRVKT